MATVRDGSNPGRAGVPERQSPAPKRKGRASALDPTNQEGQTPAEIFGMSTGLTSTGMKGSSDFKAASDVTLEAGQLDDDFGHSSESFVTDTGMPGSQGSSPQRGGETVNYTDAFGIIGGVNRDVTTTGTISGQGEWTQFNADGYSGGPTLPGLENNRPTSSGVGDGHVKGAGHPNSGQ